MATISVTFRNGSNLSGDQWTIKDGTTDQVIFNGYLAPKEAVSLSLISRDGRWGEAYYKHSGQSIFTHVDWLEAGSEVEMR